MERVHFLGEDVGALGETVEDADDEGLEFGLMDGLPGEVRGHWFWFGCGDASDFDGADELRVFNKGTAK